MPMTIEGVTEAMIEEGQYLLESIGHEDPLAAAIYDDLLEISADLRPKQQVFVDEYLKDLNASQACIRTGYSEKTARSMGVQLLAKPNIALAVALAMEDRAQRTGITADRVLQELARIAFFDPRKLFGADGSPIPIDQLDDDTAAALAGLDVLEQFEGTGADRVFVGYTKKYKVADKNTALTNAMRHLGMMRDKVEHTGKDGKDLPAPSLVQAGVLVVPGVIDNPSAWTKLVQSAPQQKE